MRESRLQFLRAFFKQLDLLPGESVKLRRITAHEMREYRTGNYRILILQATDKQGNIFRFKTQPMHSRIQFHMNREIGDSFLFCGFNQRIKQMEIINFRLQFIVKHRFERCKLRIHDDDRGRDTRFAQFGTFIGYRHSQVIDMMFLQSLGYLV